MKLARLLAVCVLFLTTTLTAWGSKEKPFTWPDLPTAATLKKDMNLQSKSGLVVLTKLCKIDIKSYLASPLGVRRDEFVRVLVLNEDGARKATLTLNDDPKAKIESIEARTVAPGGKVTKVDREKDVQEVRMKRGAGRIFGELASINFPAPEPGAVLDMHFVTFKKGVVAALVEPIAYPGTPMMDTTFHINIKGGLPGFGWSVLVVGDDRTENQMDREKDGAIRVHISPFTPNPDEPLSVPYYKNHSALLCFINLARSVGRMSWNYTLDPRGRIANFTWRKDDTAKFWGKYFEDIHKTEDKFLKHAGRAKKVAVESLAPASMPLEERVERLYEYVQTHATYNPGERHVDSLSSLVRHGFTAPWQATLYLSYLLTRAHIHHNVALVVDRYSLRFSPIVHNPYVFHFGTAVQVDIPGKDGLILMPGDLSMPYGCLPSGYQNSLAFWSDRKGNLHSAYTSVNPPGEDAMKYGYDLALSTDGGLKGSVSLKETGAPGRSFRWWQMNTTYLQAHPIKEIKMSGLDKKKKVQERLKSEMSLPGTKLAMSDFSAGKVPRDASDPTEVSCTVQGERFASAMRDKWLVYVEPLMAGFTNPFTAENRETPIWYEKGGHVTMDGVVRLPKGSTIVDVPKPVNVKGPDRTHIAFRVTAVEKDGIPAIETHLEFDRPYILGTDRYKAWKIYEGELAKLAGSRCVVSLLAQAQGELQ